MATVRRMLPRSRSNRGELLTRYYDAVHERTGRFVRSLTDAALPRIVDEYWVRRSRSECDW